MNEPPLPPPAARPPRPLETIQRWMQAVITHPEGIAAGVADAAAQQEIPLAPEQLEQVVLPSQNLSSLNRLGVYGNAYYARLLECMQSMFPALTHTLGAEVFDSFAFAYLQRFPSQSYTLDRLADHFVEFLTETRPELVEHAEVAENEIAAAAPDWPDLLIDLARLETAIEQVFDGPGAEELPLLAAEQVTALAPEHWGAARLVPSPCLTLLEFKFPLNDYYTEARAARESPLPEPGPSYLALWRRNYVVRRLPLSHVQYTLLAAILAGRTLGEALRESAEVADDFNAFAAALPHWFREFASAGFFLRVELPS